MNATLERPRARVVTRSMQFDSTWPRYGVIAPGQHTEWFHDEALADARADEINETENP